MQHHAIGILGGTFDPVHNGHLQLARYVRTHLPISSIRFIPCYQPAHRNKPIATASQRLEMLKLALQANDHFIADDREIQRQGISYMVDTLISLQEDYPNTPLCLITGSDAFANIHTWHRWKELLNLAHITVVARPDCPVATHANVLHNHYTTNKNDLSRQLSGKIYHLDMPPIPISATQIRTLLANPHTPLQKRPGLLPDKVLQYIQRHRLYQI